MARFDVRTGTAGPRAIGEAVPGTEAEDRLAGWRSGVVRKKISGSREQAIFHSEQIPSSPAGELLTRPPAKLYFGRAWIVRIAQTGMVRHSPGSDRLPKPPTLFGLPRRK
jgi:hypothetical protein